MFNSSAARLGLVAALALGVVAVTQQNAGADAGPTATDVVGVGSDIIQNAGNFLADGDIAGHLGYNGAGNKNRLVSFDSTTDANGRNAFTDPSLAGGSVPLNPTVVLRAGTSPVQRPNGGGAGITALVNDGSNGKSANRISFVRSPNLPTSAQQTAAQSNLGSQLHSVQIADDKQVIATATTTNAPVLLTAKDLVKIYTGDVTTWNQLDPKASTDTIVPLIPQNGAGVRTVFLDALKAANNGGAVTLGLSVRQVQQNDPTAITGLSAAEQKNAIVPFPVGRYKLLQSNYFRDPSKPYVAANPAPAVTADGITLRTRDSATATDFEADLPYYIIFRESDYASTVAWQPGGTLNWVRELFLNPNPADDPSVPEPFVNSAPGQALLRAAGVTPTYADRRNDVKPA